MFGLYLMRRKRKIGDRRRCKAADSAGISNAAGSEESAGNIEFSTARRNGRRIYYVVDCSGVCGDCGIVCGKSLLTR